MKRCAALVCAVLCLLLAACSSGGDKSAEERKKPRAGVSEIDTDGFLHVANEDMDTVDPQCTTEFYIVALNVFDRLVELKSDVEGKPVLQPSLAEWWEISDDGMTYRFSLREGVRFSNGNPLTVSDVRFTLERLLTNPKSVNADLVMSILGARALREGEADSLEGFRELGGQEFEIVLEEPYAAFLDCLSSPGASILDEETLYRVGDLFGVHGASTIGTGPYIISKWVNGMEMIFTANPDCWAGAPRCPGVHIRILSDAESQRILYEKGELDILDLDGLGDEAEPFLHGERYRDNIVSGSRVGITYLTLNQSIPPLDDVRVRRALQCGLDRQTILNAVYSGHGYVEHGIFPHGLDGFNPDLPEIPYDTELARALLAEAGYPDGFELELAVSDNAKQATREIVEIAAYMWEQIGVRVNIRVMDAAEYARERRAGRLACCSQGWTADFNDPDNFIYTFFGSRENSVFRGLCYGDETVMERVRGARAIVDDEKRIAEYRALEQKIIQEDAAWVPLFSRIHYFAVGDRVKNFTVSWNGWSFGFYRDIGLIGKNNG